MFDFFLTDFDRIDLYQRALKLWGTDSQLYMVIEEMAEVISELCHFLRGRYKPITLANELADAIIMSEQLAVILHHEAVARSLYGGDLAEFIAGVDEQYEADRGWLFSDLSKAQPVTILATLIGQFREMMSIADKLLIDPLYLTVALSEYSQQLAAIWIMIAEPAGRIFHDSFVSNGQLPAGKGFVNILLAAGQQKLSYLAFLITEAERDGQDESAGG